MAFPYSVQWYCIEDVSEDCPDTDRSNLTSTPCQVMIVAPKRKFHHAVDRNRVRRLTRECFRLRKHTLYEFLQQNNLHLIFSMVYIHSEIMAYEQLGHKMDKLLIALEKDILKTIGL